MIAASVWIAGYVVLRLGWACGCSCSSWPEPPNGLCCSGAWISSSAETETGRFRALTMPEVTVAFRPYGDPTRDHGLTDLQAARLAERGRA